MRKSFKYTFTKDKAKLFPFRRHQNLNICAFSYFVFYFLLPENLSLIRERSSMASKTLGFLACLLILPQIPRLKITHTCKQVMSYVKVNKVATSAATTRSLHATEVTCTPSFAQSALVVCRTNPKTISLIEMNYHTAERGATLVAAAGRSSRMWRNLAPVCSCGYVCVCVCVWQTLSCRSTKLQ